MRFKTSGLKRIQRELFEAYMLMRAQRQAAVAVAAQALKTQLKPKSKQIKTCLKAKGGRNIPFFSWIAFSCAIPAG